MKLPSWIDRLFQQEDVNFFITNQIPRRLLTRCMGWFSRIEQPMVRDVSIATFALFAGDLRLDEAKKTTFTSLHDCFVRELKDGARPVDPDSQVLVSPCDGIVGAFGPIDGSELLQAKGFSYTLEDLFAGRAAAERYRGGRYVTLRLTPGMYHRFHAPCDCRIDGATYISGDMWNVNPNALKRVARLYCRNERAVIHTRVDATGEAIAIVAVGAILVASIHLDFLNAPLNLTYRGPVNIPCTAFYRKGNQLGYFHHGSTIIVIATDEMDLCDNLCTGAVVRMGQPLLRRR
jgi:phosphatidylserine decarboxylase